MNRKDLPPSQHEIGSLLRWNIDHPGIVSENPKFNPKSWKLTVDGNVKNTLSLNWEDFLKLPAFESTSDFHCVEGWSVRNLRWYGVKFSALIDIVQPHEDVRAVNFKCLDGYTTSLKLRDLKKDNVLLAYKLNGKPLPTPLGGPLRLIVPDKYAYKSAMWIQQIIFVQEAELGYWEKRGYSDTADVWKNDRLANRKNPTS
jgi:DMSO/TMAO reductase YedYZ molybdopterin-dependent catalytic subunit